MTLLKAAEVALRKERRPRTVLEILTRIQNDSLWNTSGKTPYKTLAAILSVDVKENPDSIFVKKGKGCYCLREFDVPVGVKGFVYILTNDSFVLFKDGDNDVPIVKIGKTLSMESRLGNLNTAVPLKFKVYKCASSVKYSKIEEYIHSKLNSKSISGTEFFKCNPVRALALLRKVAKDIGAHDIKFYDYDDADGLSDETGKLIMDANECIIQKCKSSAVAKPRLRIKFADGTLIDEARAKDAFALAIKHIGVDRIVKLGEKRLLARSPLEFDRYASSAVQVGDWYLNTHSSTAGKRKILRRISKQLCVSLSF